MKLQKINLNKITAVIFDMDGVLTDTARIHAQAWKKMFDGYLKKHASRTGEEFRPFDEENDYLRYVDGKPRHDGVAGFLQSRGIELSYGDSEDDFNDETIYGLGNRKNRYYLELLKSGDVEVYNSSVTFVKQLRTKGIRVAVISASRNAGEVLKATGIQDLFDVKVDGVASAKLKLKGKPEPDIFIEAMKQLNALPENTAIIEDSIAGVEAGRKGKFKLVIGVDRANQTEELEKHGASIVVKDLLELVIESTDENKAKTLTRMADSLPSALENEVEILSRFKDKTVAIFLDYDGTLTPIVENPEDAKITEQTRRAIRKLAEYYSVAIISGRDLKDVQDMVGIEELAYAGSHGFDISGPGERYKDSKVGEKFLPSLDKAEAELINSLQDIQGSRVERKRFAIAVHYRKVEDRDIELVEGRFDEVSSRFPDLRKTGGKKVFELRPNIDWDKGKALFYLLKTLYADSSRVMPIYIGDDITDEDAFRAIFDTGIAITVGVDQRETYAHYVLQDPEETILLLEDISSRAEQEVSKGIWSMTYEGYDPDHEGLREALCTLGNGYFATRGASPEASADEIHYPGTYMAGCYNRLTTEIDGQLIENESLVNIPNWLPLTFRIEGGDWFDIDKAELLEYKQELNIQQGVLIRRFRFVDKDNRRTMVIQRRFVSMSNPHIAGLETTIVPENWSGTFEIRSSLDGRVTNSGIARYRQLDSQHLKQIETKVIDGETIYLKVETNQSHVYISEASRTRIYEGGKKINPDARVIQDSGYISQDFWVSLSEGKPIRIEKVISVCSSIENGISESGIEACKQVERASDFDVLLTSHIMSWTRLWRRCRVNVKDNERVALILNLHIFHLLQTVSPHIIDLDAGVPPRGLHGEAYRGHILWDELFIFPFLNFRIPDITRALLMYRYRRLPEARWAAKQAGYKGAMYPWQSGSDGREESQKLHLNPRSGRWIPDNSQLQRHINIAIAYNIWIYYQATEDIDFLSFYGAEMLVEIARFLSSITDYNYSTGRYEIRKVMGPDEFHDGYADSEEPGIDNNAYTNVMTVWVLRRALEVLELRGIRRQTLIEKLTITQEELERWEDISGKMQVFFHDGNIISQFEGYEKLEEFDWEGYQKKYENLHRLDRILEAEGDTPNRYKLSKQADSLMLFYLLSFDELEELFQRLGYPFTQDAITDNIEYYLKRTAHGSTLSRLVHSWVLARSKRELSWHLFKEALDSDVSDIQGGTTAEGIHLGAMAGTVDLIQRCYAGIETRQNILYLNPCLPADIREIEFDVLYHKHWINITIASEHMTIRTRADAIAPVTIGFRDELFELGPREKIRIEL